MVKMAERGIRRTMKRTHYILVEYPQRIVELLRNLLGLDVKVATPGSSKTQIYPSEVKSSVAQAIVINVQDNTHIKNELKSITEGNGDRLENQD